MSTYERPQTAGAAVLAELRRWLIEGELKPGDPIPADSIAQRLGVSRIPVREALRVLDGEGQVVYLPHRGYSVAELTMADLTELYHIRHLLESEALRQTVPELTSEDLSRMEDAMEELKLAHKEADIIRHVSANRAFHHAFLAPLDMPRLKRHIDLLYDSCDPYGSLYYNTAVNRNRSRKEHEELFKAAKAHDAKAVVEVLGKHREHVIEALSGVLSPNGEGPDSNSP